jgi:hypothetical protein
MDELTHENGGGNIVGEGDNVGDGEGGFSVEDNDEDEEFLDSEYDDEDDSSDVNEDDSGDVNDDDNGDVNEDDSGDMNDDDSGDVNGNSDSEGYTDENVDDDLEGNYDDVNESTSSHPSLEESFVIDGVEDIVKMNMFNLQIEDVAKLQFGSLEVAYNFYCWFAKMNGFAVRKGQVIKNKNGDVLQQTFVCNLEGFRKDRGLTAEERKRGPVHETRCGCGAKFRVHIDVITHRWYITVFIFDHNHEMLSDKHCGLLAAHRKLSESDKIQIKYFGNA